MQIHFPQPQWPPTDFMGCPDANNKSNTAELSRWPITVIDHHLCNSLTNFASRCFFGVSFRIWTRFRVMFFGGSAEQKCINRGELYRTTSWWEWHRLCEKHAELCEWENPPSTHEKLFPSYMHYFLVRQKMKDVDMFSKMFLCSQNCCCLTLFVKGVVLWRFWIFNQRSIFSIFNSSGRCWFCFDVGFWRCQMKDQC